MTASAAAEFRESAEGLATRRRASAPGLACFVRSAGLLAAAGITFAVSLPGAGTASLNAGLVLLAILAAHALFGRRSMRSQSLPLVGGLARVLMLLVGAGAVAFLGLMGALPEVEAVEVLLLALGVVTLDAATDQVARHFERPRPIRIAIVGHASVAESLDRELRLAGLGQRYDVVGRIAGPDDHWTAGDEVPIIGRRGFLENVVRGHDLDLLLLGSRVPRLEVFEEVGRSCLHFVCVQELSAFYELVFCHVASAEINATWFQSVLHPDYRVGSSRAERALDLTVCAVVALVAGPLLGLLALVVRRDGGPAFFTQVRIGEGGLPFTIYKLRTMGAAGASTSWAVEGDARVTPVGRILRRTHLDELPQLLNVVRGDMSIVGPRPEQPQFVDELERLVPFYQRRHLIKPGVTGWAQVRCGYAGSHAGSAWKVCHDLYYIKHRSVWLNLLIIAETFRTLVADQQYTARPLSVDFILAPTTVTAALRA